MSAVYDQLAGQRPIIPGLGKGKHHVIVCLTPFAPVVGDLPICHRKRWPHFWNVTPRRAVAEVLLLLGRQAGDVVTRPDPDGGTAICGADQSAPLAFIWDLTPAEIETARAELAAGVAP